MKVTLEIPDNAVAITVVVLCDEVRSYLMLNQVYGSNQIYDGSTLTIKKSKKEDA